MNRNLAQCLTHVDAVRLEVLARRWGLEDLPERRAEAVAVLETEMRDRRRAEATWASLSSEERAALEWLHSVGGAMAWPTFIRRWGPVRDMGPGRLRQERPWESPVSVAESLWYWGLVFRAVAEGPTGLYEVALLPEELRALLPLSPIPLFRLEPTAPPAAPVLPTDALLDDLCTLLAYFQVHPVRPTAGGQWPSFAEADLRRYLQDPDPGRWAFLSHLVRRLGWLRTDRAGHLRPAPEPVTEWLRASPAIQRLMLARAWREDPTWDDLRHVPNLRPEETGSWRNDPLLAREAILRHLAAGSPGEWYALEDFVAAIKEADPDFQRPDGNYDTWYIRDAATGEYLRGFEHWDRVEGALIRYLITGPLAWLGIVAASVEESPRFSLTPTGAAFLGQTEPPLEPPPPPMIVRPDGVLEVPAGRRYERFQVSRVADWLFIGDLSLYRLTPASLERARQQRIPPERVLTFLEETTGKPVPMALHRAVERWAQRGPEARLEWAVLLRVQDEALLRELAATPVTRRYIRELLTPTLALVSPDDAENLAQALVERGVLPDIGK
ncbi:MAG: helicase-associated domain-containing protein [Anaerolineae bacterium]|nr:helicase-associated domain-containing protein [Anaerolineae bacterium]MDW8068990.1 helicase-associated domain-containing protein [Anaerolineae bacterium]